MVSVEGLHHDSLFGFATYLWCQSTSYTQTDPQSSLGQRLGPRLPDFHFGREFSLDWEGTEETASQSQIQLSDTLRRQEEKEQFSLLAPLSGFSIYVCGFPGDSDSKESACKVGDLGSIPRLGRSPEGGDSNPFQYSWLGNPKDWKSLPVDGVKNSQIRLNN